MGGSLKITILKLFQKDTKLSPINNAEMPTPILLIINNNIMNYIRQIKCEISNFIIDIIDDS